MIYYLNLLNDFYKKNYTFNFALFKQKSENRQSFKKIQTIARGFAEKKRKIFFK